MGDFDFELLFCFCCLVDFFPPPPPPLFLAVVDDEGGGFVFPPPAALPLPPPPPIPIPSIPFKAAVASLTDLSVILLSWKFDFFFQYYLNF
jgi:hypothetical protein